MSILIPFCLRKTTHHLKAGTTMHHWRFSTLDRDQYTSLSGRVGKACKPAGPHTAGEPQTEERRQSKMRFCTASMIAAHTSVGCPHAQTLMMYRALRSPVLPVHHPLHPTPLQGLFLLFCLRYKKNKKNATNLYI